MIHLKNRFNWVIYCESDYMDRAGVFVLLFVARTGQLKFILGIFNLSVQSQTANYHS